MLLFVFVFCDKVLLRMLGLMLLLSGLVLVTDAITAMGLPPGRHPLGQQIIEIQGLHAYVAGLIHFQRSPHPTSPNKSG